MKERYDVIVVGTGAAGLYCALNLPERKKILMITKKEADQSDSFLAQGGICMLRGEADYNDYFEDTMRAGQDVYKRQAIPIRSADVPQTQGAMLVTVSSSEITATMMDMKYQGLRCV